MRVPLPGCRLTGRLHIPHARDSRCNLTQYVLLVGKEMKYYWTFFLRHPLAIICALSIGKLCASDVFVHERAGNHLPKPKGTSHEEFFYRKKGVKTAGVSSQPTNQETITWGTMGDVACNAINLPDSLRVTRKPLIVQGGQDNQTNNKYCANTNGSCYQLGSTQQFFVERLYLEGTN